MISASGLFLQYGDRKLLNYVSFVIKPKDKIGLVGRNGAGKSTILKIIAGEVSTMEGNISYPRNASLGFLHQELFIPAGKTLLQEVESAFDHIKKIEDNIEAINVQLGERTDYESDDYSKLLDDLADLTESLGHNDAQSKDAQIATTLKGLGFQHSDFDRLTEEFSGGWQMRIILAKMLLQQPDYLLLDEPTNHLDIESIVWLENFLKSYHGAVILISHDKQFLDNITNRTLEIEMGKIYDFASHYSKYLIDRQERRTQQMASLKNQQREIAQKEKIINKFMAKANKTKMAQSMQKQLNKMERIEIDVADTRNMKLLFPPPPRSGAIAVEVNNLSKKFGDIQVLTNVNLKIDRGERIAFVGQNGQGKTTLAKIIIDKLNYTSGEKTLGHNIKIGYYAQDQSEALPSKLTLLETLEEEAPAELSSKLRGILGSFMFSGDDQTKKVSVLSGGERARLALACLLLHPFNLLVLDEPTNHLDIASKEVLKEALKAYEGTLIVVSHDRDFLAGLTEKTIEFRDQKLTTHLGDVNYFLKKSALRDMRAFELDKKKVKKVSTPQELSKEEKHIQNKIKNEVKNLERKIEKIEEKISAVELIMGKNDFYQAENYQETVDKHNALKKDLAAVMIKWEEKVEEI